MTASRHPMRAVVLCGGSGARLWPRSRRALPKQFLPMWGGPSLLERTLRRLRAAVGDGEPIVAVSGAAHRFLVQDACAACGERPRLLLEPVARNTAPAIAAAALDAEGDDPLLLISPADGHIPDTAAFSAAIEAGRAAAEAGAWVTLGVRPTWPATGYGYIDPEPGPGAVPVRRFLEKPDQAGAIALIEAGTCRWNAGIFLVRARVALDDLRRHRPGLVEAVQRAWPAEHGELRTLGSAFAEADDISIDYAVLERHDRVAMVPFDGAWSDVGSWDAVASFVPADGAGNRAEGPAVFVQARGNYVHAVRPVALLGVDDLVVVDTPDALLVARRDAGESMRAVLDAARAAGWTQADAHREVHRPWGTFDSLERGDGFQVKRLTVRPGASLSLQSHRHRAEHWIVVAGTATVTCDDRVFTLESGGSTFIPVGARHRLANPGTTPLVLVEVQCGAVLDEDDIVRYVDAYGRADG